MTSPRKRAGALRRNSASPKGRGDSPDAWVSAANFKFAESPVRQKNNDTRNSAGRPKGARNKDRRQSVMILKRLDLPLSAANFSPSDRRKTRRQSIALMSRKLTTTHKHISSKVLSPNINKPAIFPKIVKPSSPSQEKNTRAKVTRLPPKKPALTKAEVPKKSPVKIPFSTKAESPSKSPGISLSPQKFYSSPKKREILQPGHGKRTAELGDALEKLIDTPKKIKIESRLIVQLERCESPSVKSPSPKRSLRSAIPRRKGSVSTTALSPLKEDKSFKSTARAKSQSILKSELKEKTPEKDKKDNTQEPKSPEFQHLVTASLKTPKKVSVLAVKGGKTPKIQSKSKSSIISPPKSIKGPKSKEKEKMLKSSPVVERMKTPKSPEKTRSLRNTRSTPLKAKSLSALPRKATPSPKKVETLKIKSPKKNTTPKGLRNKSLEKKHAANLSPIKLENIITKCKSAKNDDSSVKSKSPVKVKTDSPMESQNLPEISLKKTPLKKQKIKTPRLLSELGLKSPVLSRSRTRSSVRKVTLVGKSPQAPVSSFRKTPASTRVKTPMGKSKSLQAIANDCGASPILSARVQLAMIRGKSPMKLKRRSPEKKVVPFTPKPDSPPSHVLRKTLRKKVAQKMHATTKVEVHQLMNGEISRPVKFITGTKTTTASITVTETKSNGTLGVSVTPRKGILKVGLDDDFDKVDVTGKTPVSTSNLPPTPTSSRKRIESIKSSRSINSLTTGVQCSLVTAPPRSSTPIEDEEDEDGILKPLSVGSIIQNMQKDSAFMDDSIKTDKSEEDEDEEDENCPSEVKETNDTTPEKSKRSFCSLM